MVRRPAPAAAAAELEERTLIAVFILREFSENVLSEAVRFSCERFSSSSKKKERRRETGQSEKEAARPKEKRKKRGLWGERERERERERE